MAAASGDPIELIHFEWYPDGGVAYIAFRLSNMGPGGAMPSFTTDPAGLPVYAYPNIGTWDDNKPVWTYTIEWHGSIPVAQSFNGIITAPGSEPLVIPFPAGGEPG